MSAGSQCLENMIAGRLQDIMVILRSQCNNKANLLVTLDSASHSLLREYTYVLKVLGSCISRSLQEQHGGTRRAGKTEKRCSLCFLNETAILGGKFKEISKCLQDYSASKL